MGAAASIAAARLGEVLLLRWAQMYSLVSAIVLPGGQICTASSVQFYYHVGSRARLYCLVGSTVFPCQVDCTAMWARMYYLGSRIALT